jgi:hypothetical protein
VPDGIFNQRLEHQVGHPGWQYIAVNLKFNRESVLEQRFLNLQVLFEEFKLFAQRDFLVLAALERGSKQVTQLGNGSISQVRMVIDQFRDGIQSIEQKMWVNLHFQRLKLSLGKARNQAGTNHDIRA